MPPTLVTPQAIKSPVRRRWLKVLGVITLTIAALSAALPYIAGCLLLAYLGLGNGTIARLSIVPQERTLHPESEIGAGHFFQISNDLSFISPLASTTASTSSALAARFISGDRHITIIRRDPEVLTAERNLILKLNKLITKGGEQPIQDDFDFLQRTEAVTPSHLFGTPAKTAANTFLLFFKATWAPGGGNIQVMQTPSVKVVQTTSEVKDGRLSGGIHIFDVSGAALYDVAVRSLTQGQIDAFIGSIVLSSQAPAIVEAIYIGTTTKVTLGGTLQVKEYYGPPNYGETPETDSKEKAVVLELMRPFDISDMTHVAGDSVTEIQLTDVPTGVDVSARGYRFVTGTLFLAETSYHHTPVIYDVQKVSIPVQVLDDYFATDGAHIYVISTPDGEPNDPPSLLKDIDAKTFQLHCSIPNSPAGEEFACDATHVINRALPTVVRNR